MMFKTAPLFILLLACTASARAQYYYKDILSNRQLLSEMNFYRENRIKTVNVKSFDDDGTESEGFFCQKKISRNYKETALFTRADIAAASEFTSEFDTDGKLLHTNDSSALSVTDISYSYDAKRQMSSIVSRVHSQDEDFNNNITEEHIYKYSDAGRPEKMFLVKNKKDTAEIDFAVDEKGNIAIEKNTRNGATFFYYYDAKNRLTDIVHGSGLQEQQLRPDYIFEYNSSGQVAQMTSVQEGTANYFIWKYVYDNGLRIIDKCYSDEKKLLGSLQYEYK